MRPAAERLARLCYRTAAASAVAVALIVAWIIQTDALAHTADRVGAGVLLAIPAAAAWLLGSTLAGLARLPGQLLDAATGRSSDATGRRPGLIGSLRTVLRALVAGRSAWEGAAWAARLVRLVRLPVVAALASLVLLNGPVLVGGIAAALALLWP